MIGKMIGKVAGTVLALPAVIGNAAKEAVEETEKTVTKAYDKLEK